MIISCVRDNTHSAVCSSSIHTRWENVKFVELLSSYLKAFDWLLFSIPWLDAERSGSSCFSTRQQWRINPKDVSAVLYRCCASMTTRPRLFHSAFTVNTSTSTSQTSLWHFPHWTQTAMVSIYQFPLVDELSREPYTDPPHWMCTTFANALLCLSKCVLCYGGFWFCFSITAAPVMFVKCSEWKFDLRLVFLLLMDGLITEEKTNVKNNEIGVNILCTWFVTRLLKQTCASAESQALFCTLQVFLHHVKRVFVRSHMGSKQVSSYFTSHIKKTNKKTLTATVLNESLGYVRCLCVCCIQSQRVSAELKVVRIFCLAWHLLPAICWYVRKACLILPEAACGKLWKTTNKSFSLTQPGEV